MCTSLVIPTSNENFADAHISLLAVRYALTVAPFECGGLAVRQSVVLAHSVHFRTTLLLEPKRPIALDDFAVDFDT